METLNYYRGYELLTDEQVAYMDKVWGISKYNHIEKLPMDSNTGTGLMDVTNMLYTIWNNQLLYFRELEIIERIKKGPKQSRARFADHYTTVEGNMLQSLFIDAAIQYNHTVEKEDKINYSYGFPMEEIKRLYGLKYSSIMDEVKQSEEKMLGYSKNHEYVKYGGFRRDFGDQLRGGKDPSSTYYTYFFNLEPSKCGSLSHYNTGLIKRIEKRFPFLGKLGFFSGWGDSKTGTLQIYVYDYANTDNNFQMVMDYLIENKLIDIKFETLVD